MAITITLIVVALAAGYFGARMERKRSSEITKREATALRRKIAAIELKFNEHIDVHKTLKYHIETLNHSVGAIGQVVGMEQSDQSRSLH
jgi:hypothetical protein